MKRTLNKLLRRPSLWQAEIGRYPLLLSPSQMSTVTYAFLVKLQFSKDPARAVWGTVTATEANAEDVWTELKEKVRGLVSTSRSLDKWLEATHATSHQATSTKTESPSDLADHAIGYALWQYARVANDEKYGTQASDFISQLNDKNLSHLSADKRHLFLDPEAVDFAALAQNIDRYRLYPFDESVSASEANDFSSEQLPGAHHGLKAGTIRELVALQMGFSTIRYPGDALFITDADQNTVAAYWKRFTHQVAVGNAKMTSNKELTRATLESHGIHIATGFIIPHHKRHLAAKRAKDIGWPVVVKPSNGSLGEGISTDITSAEQLDAAIEKAFNCRYEPTAVVVERQINGSDYRILATPDEVLSVIRRDPARVTGDGHRSFLQLILAANAERASNPLLTSKRIVIGEEVEKRLANEGWDLQSIPPAGYQMRLAGIANLTSGGTSTEVLDETHPSILAEIKKAVGVIGPVEIGVDIMMEDHRLALDEQEITILEMNSTPGKTIHTYPMYGPRRNVYEHELKRFLDSPVSCEATTGSELSVRVTVTGNVTGTDFPAWIKRGAKKLNIQGWARESAQAGGTVEALLQGDPPAVAVLARRCLNGPSSAYVLEVVAQPQDIVQVEGFRIDD